MILEYLFDIAFFSVLLLFLACYIYDKLNDNDINDLESEDIGL